MNAIMTKVYGFFTDADGGLSYGRLASAYCVTAALLLAVAGLWIPAMASYCADLVGSFLLTGAGFYGTSKGQQVFTSWVGKRPGTNPNPSDEQR